MALCLAPAASPASERLASLDTGGIGEVTRSMTIAADAGPIIRVFAPQGFSLDSPVDFDVSFDARDGVPVAMQTLRIDYRVGPIWRDVTDRITRHGSVSGTRLRASGAELPKGRHMVRLTVSDTQDRETVAIVRFAVH